MNLPLRTVFIVSHKFGFVVASSSFKSIKKFNFLFEFCLDCFCSVVNCSVPMNLRTFAASVVDAHFNSWWSDKMQGDVSNPTPVETGFMSQL